MKSALYSMDQLPRVPEFGQNYRADIRASVPFCSQICDDWAAKP
jgi:hypothetical protein